MDLLRSLLGLVQPQPRELSPGRKKSRTKAARCRGAGAAKASGKSGSHRGKRELTAAQAVREAELRG